MLWIIYLLLLPALTCSKTEEGDMRFEGDENNNASCGVIEIYHRDQWGAICDDEWDIEGNFATEIACRNLNFTDGEKPPICATDKQRNFVMNDVNCSDPNLPSLLNCSHTNKTEDCRDQEAVVLNCFGRVSSSIPTPTPTPTSISITMTPISTMTPTPSQTPCQNNDTQLVNRLVEVCCNGKFQSVCDDYWSYQDGEVVCRQLGFFPYCVTLIKEGEFLENEPIQYCLDDVRCKGSETSLFDCKHSTEHNCNNKERAGVHCLNKDDVHVSLTDIIDDGSTIKGIVRISIRNQSGYICSNGWSNEDVRVVCGELKFKEFELSVDGTGLHSKPMQKGETYFLDRVKCMGDEKSVLACSSVDESCSERKCSSNIAAGVICKKKNDRRKREEREEPSATTSLILTTAYPTILIPTPSPSLTTLTSLPSCRDRDIRLVEGNETSGLVEVCCDGEFQSVCDDYWNVEDGKVVCNQLGLLPYCVAIIRRGQFLVNEPVQYCLDDVRCKGSETSLFDCKHSTEHNCNNKERAGVHCLNEDDVHVSLTDIIDDGSTIKGIVRISIRNQSGYICSNGWSIEDAGVVCGELGHSPDGAGVYYKPMQKGETYFLDRAKCMGDEISVLACSSLDKSCSERKCSTNIAAGVICEKDNIHDRRKRETEKSLEEQCMLLNRKECEDGETRLVRNEDHHYWRQWEDGEGLVQICLDNEWRYICNHQWNNTDATVFCKSHNIQTNNSRATRHQYDIEDPVIYYWLDEVVCSGNESNLMECNYTIPEYGDFCSTERAAVICNDTSYECEQGTTRLVNNGNFEWEDGEGLVQICLDNEWRYVCNNKWNNNSADVFCRSHDLISSNSRATTNQYYMNVPFIHYWLDEVVCTGNESNLLDCNHTTPEYNFCSSERAGVICDVSYFGCDENATRLVRYENEDYDWKDGEGVVQICLNGEWRYICNDQWNDTNAMVVCESLNMLTSESRATRNQYFIDEPYTLYWLDEVVCTGNESNLLECNHTLLHDCGPSERAAVICNETVGNIVRLAPAEDLEILGRYSHHYIKEYQFAKQVNCTITGNQQRINGTIRFNIRADRRSFEVNATIVGLDDGKYEWGISDKNYSLLSGQGCPDSIFDPENKICSSCNYEKDCNTTKDLCAAGDYSGRFIHLNSSGKAIVIEDRLSIDQLIGKYMFIKPLDGNAIACGVLIPEYECDEGDIVMTIVGREDFVGPVEICIHGTWHRVCDTNWTRADAEVACKQLELETVEPQAVYFNDFEIELDNEVANVSEACNCLGFEEDLYDCLASNLERPPGPLEKIVGVLCQKRKEDRG